MSMPSKIAAVGEADSMLLFRAMGVQTYETHTPQETEKAVTKAAREGAAVIYITERAAQGIGETLERYRLQPFPAIIPIPGSEGSLGTGQAALKADMEKAIGMDIDNNE